MDGGLNSLFQSHLKQGWHWQRVETGAVGAGVPDLNYCHSNFEGWLELKGTDGWLAGIRPEQNAWIARRIRMGGNVFIAVRRQHNGGPRRGEAVDELWLYCGCKVQQLLTTKLMLVQPLGMWHGGPEAWAWGAIAAKLTKHCIHAGV